MSSYAMNDDKNNAVKVIKEAEEALLDDGSTTEVVEILPEVAAVTEATFKTTSVALIMKLLQFSTPHLDTKLVKVLFLEHIMDIFMTHVSRLDLEQEKIDLKTCDFDTKLLYSKHKRNFDDIEALKRSYHAMELLSGTTANHLWVQDAKFDDIVNHLFEMFLPNSHGNFNHFLKIFQHLVRRHPDDMLEFVIIRDNASIIFDYMLPYLTESSVMDSILSLIFVRDTNPEIKQNREKSHDKLYKLGFLEWIVSKMQLEDHPEYVEAAQEFLMRVIEEASQVDNGDILFKALKEEKGSEIMQTLVKQVINNTPSVERGRTINIIKLLAKSGLLTTRASSLSQPVQGPLYSVSLRSQELLVKHIPDFCSLFARDRQHINTRINAPLRTSDMDLLDIIYQTLYNVNEKPQMLASIPNAFWKILVNFFFEKSSSNIYHVLFYRIVCLTLSINYEPTLIVLVRKQSLITRLINEYQDRKRITETRGFVLLILNQLRLMADAHHSDLISRIVSLHPLYQEFLPTLRKDTLSQTEPIYAWKLACPRPPTHLGPTPPIHATLPLMSNANDNDDASGIDLGSDFAYCLGFKETAIGAGITAENGTETAHECLSRRNSGYSSSQSTNEGFPMDFIWGESLTANEDHSEESSSENKKKKRR